MFWSGPKKSQKSKIFWRGLKNWGKLLIRLENSEENWVWENFHYHPMEIFHQLFPRLVFKYKKKIDLEFNHISTISFSIIIDGLPVHENLFFVIDAGQEYTDLVQTILSQLFDGINLLKYRLSVYTTNGVFKHINEFQSRKCTILDITRY